MHKFSIQSSHFKQLHEIMLFESVKPCAIPLVYQTINLKNFSSIILMNFRKSFFVDKVPFDFFLFVKLMCIVLLELTCLLFCSIKMQTCLFYILSFCLCSNDTLMYINHGHKLAFCLLTHFAF